MQHVNIQFRIFNIRYRRETSMKDKSCVTAFSITFTSFLEDCLFSPMTSCISSCKKINPSIEPITICLVTTAFSTLWHKTYLWLTQLTPSRWCKWNFTRHYVSSGTVLNWGTESFFFLTSSPSKWTDVGQGGAQLAEKVISCSHTGRQKYQKNANCNVCIRDSSVNRETRLMIWICGLCTFTLQNAELNWLYICSVN